MLAGPRCTGRVSDVGVTDGGCGTVQRCTLACQSTPARCRCISPRDPTHLGQPAHGRGHCGQTDVMEVDGTRGDNLPKDVLGCRCTLSWYALGRVSRAFVSVVVVERSIGLIVRVDARRVEMVYGVRCADGMAAGSLLTLSEGRGRGRLRGGGCYFDPVSGTWRRLVHTTS